jgi:hypothetical protein
MKNKMNYKHVIFLVFVVGFSIYYFFNYTFVKPKAKDIEIRILPIKDTLVFGMENSIEILDKGEAVGHNVHILWGHFPKCLGYAIDGYTGLKYTVTPLTGGCPDDYMEIGARIGDDTIVFRKFVAMNPTENMLARIKK